MSNNPTKDELARLIALRAERSSLDRQSASLKKEEDAIDAKVRTWLTAKGKAACTRLGYAIALVAGNRYPKWKEAFIQKCGQEAATAIESATEPSQRLTIVATK